MATLVSPGVSISVIDQSINVGAGPGTVPLIFIATQQDKMDPTGTTVAVGTTQANAGKVWSITSQRDLVSTFGDPVFYSVSGTSLNGYPLNEYGLLAAYSYLGISNLTRVVRADIDTVQLEATPIEPTSPAAVGTYWLDETASAFGLFIKSGTQWVHITPDFIFNNTTPTGGVNNNIAVVWTTATGELSYWIKDPSDGWQQMNSNQVIIQSVWPNLPATTQSYWVKTTSPAQGANLVLRRMNANTGSFVQVEAPILADDTAADLYYSTNPLKSAGQVYIRPSVSPTPNVLQFRYSSGQTASWAPLQVIIGSLTVPTQGPANGQLWFNSLLGLDSNGMSTVDILINDGADHWLNCNLPGFSLPGAVGNPTLYAQSGDPQSNVPVPVLTVGDVWVDTDVAPYPVIKRWSGSAWVLVDNTNQTTPSGIIFQDARPNPLYKLGGVVGTGENNGGGNNPDLDADAPQAALYPAGFLLWNTRYSTNNVKTWVSPYVFDSITASPDNTNNDSTGRWVDASGNNPGGVPYMGAAAQQIMIVKAIQSTIVANEEIRAEDLYFNLIAAPGFVEAIDEMLVLNEDRKNTAFVVGDTPFTLNATGTALQNWSTNASLAYSNGTTGLTSASKYFAAWYPSGLSTNVDGTDVVVPPSHMALRTIAYNDQVAYPWFAPAGLQRGVVNNAASVGYVNAAGQYIPTKLNEGQRDILYTNGINPIRTMPQGGIVVFGQKTRQPYSSATDRINVVRLENYLRYQLNNLAAPFLFEPNDSTTRKAITDAFNRFLQELITLRGLYDFLVVCDLSNNTPARIDRNELWIDIAIQPVKAIEFIYIPIRIMNTGASLSA
jgi:hypothetical protein